MLGIETFLALKLAYQQQLSLEATLDMQMAPFFIYAFHIKTAKTDKAHIVVQEQALEVLCATRFVDDETEEMSTPEMTDA